MQKFLGILMVGILMVGCNSSSPSVKTVESSDNNRISVDRVETQPVSGEVQKKRVKPGVTCDTEQKPVCGKVSDRQKNAFLNACEADRHYAEVLNEGFCGRDNSVKNSCKARVMGIGNCTKSVTGWEFVNGSCEKVVVSGCDAEVPFESIEACDRSCK